MNTFLRIAILASFMLVGHGIAQEAESSITDRINEAVLDISTSGVVEVAPDDLLYARRIDLEEVLANETAGNQLNYSRASMSGDGSSISVPTVSDEFMLHFFFAFAGGDLQSAVAQNIVSMEIRGSYLYEVVNNINLLTGIGFHAVIRTKLENGNLVGETELVNHRKFLPRGVSTLRDLVTPAWYSAAE